MLFPHGSVASLTYTTLLIVFVFLDRRRNMRWSYRIKSQNHLYKSLFSINKPNQNLVSFTCSHCVGGFGTCGGSRRYGFVLFTTEVCVRSSMVFCIETIWSNVSLYRIDFTCVTNLLRFVSKRLVSKRLCIEMTVNHGFALFTTEICFRSGMVLVSKRFEVTWVCIESTLLV